MIALQNEERNMSKKLVIRHDLHTMSKEELNQYLRDVSEFIGLDPDLNGLDAIWMPNESGQGQSLVVYARRGTAEILRNLLGVDVDELSSAMMAGSIVFTAKGHNGKGRKEQAVGSKYLGGLTGKVLDDAIMTASTRALRRLTMQFTTLGILDESEVSAAKGEAPAPNPAAAAVPAPNPLPPVFSQPTVPANNAPGRPVDPSPAPIAPPAPPVAQLEPLMAVNPTDALASLEDAAHEAEKRPKRARKPKTVVLDVEPETVSVPAPVSAVVETPQSGETQSPPPMPTLPANPPPAPVEGMPTSEQMDGYRKKIAVFTNELPGSDGMTSVQKMRAFITRMSEGTAPQNMTVTQWGTMIAWFDNFVATNGVRGLVKYIHDTLGVK
jgi:hypothetical protein